MNAHTTFEQDVQISDCAELRHYWSDPAYRAQCDAEVAANRALCNAAIDRGMAALNQKQRDRWAAEEASGGAL